MTAQHLTAALLFTLLMIVPLPFLPEFGGANSASRAMLTAALVEDGTTRIDRHAEKTPDKAQVGAHSYSDKAPGMALLAVPAYATGYALAPEAAAALFRIEEPLDDLPRATMLIWRALTWTSGGLLLALAGVALYRMALRLGAGPVAALMSSLSVCLATPLLGWSVQFFGHVGAGAGLALAFALSTGLGRQDVLLSEGPRVMLAGAALSLAVSIEYTAAPPALLIALYALWRLGHLPRARALPLFGWAVGAALVAALPMLLYHWASFGSPFRVGYSSVVGFEGMQQGFLGLTAPDPVVLTKMLFSLRRGILWLCPLLLLLPWAFWVGARRPGLRPELALCLTLMLYYLLLNASYHYWAGGLSLGPRHTMPALFFTALPFALLWETARGRLRQGLWGLFAVSAFFSLASASVTMTPIGSIPLWDPVLLSLFTERNAFFRMAHWGLAPGAVFGLWLCLSLGLLALLWRSLPRPEPMPR